MQRRALIRLALWTAAWFPLRGVKLGAAVARARRAQVDEATLQPLALTVLPESLGAVTVTAVVTGFRRWLNGYKAGSEMTHGYGLTRLRVTDPDPEPGYICQLADLEAAARRAGGSFAELALDARRSLVAAALESAGVTELPRRPDGRHVISDLMSFYFQSSEANDLCYRARIGRRTCRGLPDSESAPRPL